MKKTMKIRLAVFLSILLVLPTIVAALPMASTEALAAGNDVSMYWNWDVASHPTIEVEAGQQFYLGDYAILNIYGKKPWYGRVSLVKATYTSSKKAVATVNKSGYFTAKKTGTTTVTVKYKGKKITTKIKVVPKGTFATSENISGLQKKAEALSKQIPKKITTKNGFALYKVVSDYQKYTDEVNDIGVEGFLKEAVTVNGNYTYYKNTAQLAVPQAGRYAALNAMLSNYGWENNPTGTKGAKLFKIKSVSATKSSIVIKLKKKIDTVQVLATRINGYNLGNEELSGNTKAYAGVYVYDKKTHESFRCKAEVKKGSNTLKLIPMKYSPQKGEWVKTTLKKGHTYVLETRDYWTKGKTVKVK